MPTKRLRKNRKKRLALYKDKFLKRTGKTIARGFKGSPEDKKLQRENRYSIKNYEFRQGEKLVEDLSEKLEFELISDDIFYRVLNYSPPPKNRFGFDNIRGKIQYYYILATPTKNRSYELSVFVFITFPDGRTRKFMDWANADRALKDLWLACSREPPYIYLRSTVLKNTDEGGIIWIDIESYYVATIKK